jgi:hypothetical protein
LDAINKEVCNGVMKIGEGILTPMQVSKGTTENTIVAEDKTAQN